MPKVEDKDLEKYNMTYIEGQQFTNCNGEWIRTEENLLKEIWHMNCLVTSSYDTFQVATVNRTMLAEEYADCCLEVLLKTDLSPDSENYVFNLFQLAKKVFDCSYKEIIVKCLSYAWDLTEQGTYIIKDITGALNTLEIIDCKLVYPKRWFSKLLYKNISELLKTFDFERTKYLGRVAYEKQGEFTAEQVLEVAKELKGVSLSTKFDFFPTPQELVCRVQELANLQDGDYILEPSAGTGSLLEHIKAGKITCVEMNDVLCGILRGKGYPTLNVPFEEAVFAHKFDKILMNPPFGKRMDAKHIVQAFNNLKEGGILVSIHSSAIVSATDKHSKSYQKLYREYGNHREKVDTGAFKDSGKGTMVDTYITVLVR